MSFGYYGYNGYESGVWAAILAGLAAYFLVILAIVAVIVIGLWKMFEKAGEDGWKAIVPFLNLYIINKIAWGNGIYFLLAFVAPIPVIGWLVVLIYTATTYYKLSKSFGKDTGFAVGLYFLPMIFYLILGFGDAKYLGVYEDGNYYHPDFPPQQGFSTPWEFVLNSKKQNYGGQAYGQQGYPNQGYQNQGGYQGQGGFQGQPMNQGQGGFQGQPMNYGQGGFQSQPMHSTENQQNNINQQNSTNNQ